MADNLPQWPGAATAYSRAYLWTNAVAAESYRAAYAMEKRRPKNWRVPEDVATAIDALNRGDEEMIKALNWRYVRHWAPRGGEA